MAIQKRCYRGLDIFLAVVVAFHDEYAVTSVILPLKADASINSIGWFR